MDLLARGRDEVLAYPTVALRAGRVEGLTRRPDEVFAASLGGEQVTSLRVVLACGVQDAGG